MGAVKVGCGSWCWDLLGCWGCWDLNKGEDLQWFCDGRQSSSEESSCLAAGWPTSLWQEIHLVITRHWLLDCLPKIWGMIYDWKIKNYSLFRKGDDPCERSQMVKAKTFRITNTNTDENCNQMSDLWEEVCFIGSWKDITSLGVVSQIVTTLWLDLSLVLTGELVSFSSPEANL